MDSSVSKTSENVNDMVSMLIDPPCLIRWMPNKDKKASIILLDMEVDIIGEGRLRFDLNVAFKAIPVHRGIIQKADYYIGSTGAHIIFETDKGSVFNYTVERDPLKVNHTNTVTRTRNSSASLKPAITNKEGDKEVKLELGEISWSAKVDSVFVSTFSCNERSLNSIYMESAIHWLLNLPRGERVISDYLVGNLWLFAECLWKDTSPSGDLSVRPSDVRFFNDDKRPLPSYKSIAMLYSMWRQNIKLPDYKGVKTHFQVDQGEK